MRIWPCYNVAMGRVVAGLIKMDGKYLLAKRSSGAEELLGRWEFPGGKVEDGETDAEALEREIIEEFNTMVKVGGFLAKAKINDRYELRLYACEHVLGPFRPKEHSEIVWKPKLEDFASYDLAPADKDLLEQLTHKKEPTGGVRTAELRVGAAYVNSDLVHIFQVSSQGGMRRSRKTNSLVLISKHAENNPYDDAWRDGEFHYTGMGMTGDQDINYMQNQTLAASDVNGVNVYLFESFNPNEYIYRGQVELCGEPYYETQKDSVGRFRKVVKFPLRLK